MESPQVVAPTPNLTYKPTTTACRQVVYQLFRTGLFAPLLAILAYLPVLNIGFIGDDFGLLQTAQQSGIDLAVFWPYASSWIYRPVSSLLTWQLGWYLWGYNPFPYHLMGLLIHAATAWVLARWAIEIATQPVLGSLIGALFAVFPLHLEAVGWLAAQWDAWATLFGLLSLWLFTIWLRRSSGWVWYFLAVGCYGLGLFSKESMLGFLPVLILAAWAARAGNSRRPVAALVPFVGLLALNVGVRFLAWGRLVGPGSPLFPTDRVWDSLIQYAHVMMAPVNTTIFSRPLQQATGLLTSAGLILGLLWHQPRYRQILLLTGTWLLVTLIPVLTFGIDLDTLGGNRFVYLPLAGYCTAAGILLYSGVSALRHGQAVARGLIGLLMVAGILTCWMQLEPWQTATAQIKTVGQELHRLVPPQSHPTGLIWYVDAVDPADSYRGVTGVRFTIGSLRYFLEGERLWLRHGQQAIDAPLTSRPEDSFAVHFVYDAATARFHVGYLAGVTAGAPPPPSSDVGELWDFRRCDASIAQSLVSSGTQVSCRPGRGVVIQPASAQPQLTTDQIRGSSGSPMPRFLRLRTAAINTGATTSAPRQLIWWWRHTTEDWSVDQSRSLPVTADNQQHIYWTFLPTAGMAAAPMELRFTASGNNDPIVISWIAADFVP